MTPSVSMKTNINDRTWAQQHEKSRPVAIANERLTRKLMPSLPLTGRLEKCHAGGFQQQTFSLA